jgi:hypothetical protein
MPTLDDLSAAFAELERLAPPALRDPIRPPRRRRWAAVGLAAACTAAVAVAIPLATRPGDAPAQPGNSGARSNTILPATVGFEQALPAPAAGVSPNLAYGFATGGVGDAVRPDLVTRTYQHATITGDAGDGELFVFYAGAYDSSVAREGTPVAVAGRQGYYARVPIPGAAGTQADALVWEYADNAWALVTVDTGSGDPTVKDAGARARAQQDAENQARTAYVRQLELSLAERTRAASDPLTSPVRIPAASGSYVDSMSSSGPDGGLVLAGSGATWDLGWSPDPLSPADKPGTSTTEIGSHTWIVYTSGGAPSSLGLVADGFGLTITPVGGASLGQLEQFAAALQVASDPSDPSTWFDAGTNLP